MDWELSWEGGGNTKKTDIKNEKRKNKERSATDEPTRRKNSDDMVVAHTIRAGGRSDRKKVRQATATKVAQCCQKSRNAKVAYYI